MLCILPVTILHTDFPTLQNFWHFPKNENTNAICLLHYHIKHMPQILLILALQNTDMLRLL